MKKQDAAIEAAINNWIHAKKWDASRTACFTDGYREGYREGYKAALGSEAWVNVSDGLPEYTTHVLVALKAGLYQKPWRVIKVFFRSDIHRFTDPRDEYFSHNDVLAWMHIPEIAGIGEQI